MSNSLHSWIISQLKQHTNEKTTHSKSYHGTQHHYYGVASKSIQQIAKTIKKEHSLSLDEWIALLDTLYTSNSYEEKALAGTLLSLYSKYRQQLTFTQLDKWLGELVGWAEVDNTCQSVFSATELLDNWQEWESFLKKLASDKNKNKRRASLVLLTHPVSKNSDKRLQRLAIENIETLKYEKDILITKAISWLLRDLIAHHRVFIRRYVQENRDTLPKIAYRETMRKIETGRK